MKKHKLVMIGLFLVFTVIPAMLFAEQITNPDILRSAGNIIRGVGYQCPECKQASNRGLVPRGLEISVWCGPVGKDSLYWDLRYRIILHPETGRVIHVGPIK